jgi:hypothetical protein
MLATPRIPQEADRQYNDAFTRSQWARHKACDLIVFVWERCPQTGQLATRRTPLKGHRGRRKELEKNARTSTEKTG